MNKSSFCSWNWNGIKAVDILLLFFLFLSMMIAIHKTVLARQTFMALKPVVIELVVPNLDPLVASQINVSDKILDQQGQARFEIIQKTERASEHPGIDQKGNILVSPHPQLLSLFLTLRSLEPMQFENGIKYNWQVIKIGGLLIWETRYCRFVGLIRKID